MEAGLPAEPNVFQARLRAAGVVGVLRAPNARIAVEAARAAVRGGLRALEVTFTIPGAEKVLRELQASLPGTVFLGAGTLMTPPQVRAAVKAGARFLVSPHLDEDLHAAALELNVPYVPGVITPTEVARARVLGVPLVKLFPIGSSGGAAYLKDLLGPFPDLRAIVTGGVAPAEVPAYLRAGAVAAGLGAHLFPPRALQDGDWPDVERCTLRALAAANERGEAREDA